jgi:hypothetical protein
MWRVAFVFLWGALIAVTAVNRAHASLRYTFETHDGLAYILVEGDFALSDNLDEFAASVRLHNPTAVIFNSPGGNIFKAIEFGRLVRSLKLNTVQIRGLECSSACALAFLGGVSRNAEPGSIGVHKSSFADTAGMSINEAVSAVQETTAQVVTYMVQMGVDPSLLELSLSYESDDMRYLSKSEMEHYKVVTTGAQRELTTNMASSPAAPSSPTPAQPAENSPQPRPVEVAGRKVPYSQMPGDQRSIGWVYVNVCSTAVVPAAEAMRRSIDTHTFQNMRIIAAQVGYFDPATTTDCSVRQNLMKTYLNIRARTRDGSLVPAATELFGVLSPFGVTVDGRLGTLSQPEDDDFRFDVWVTGLPAVSSPASNSSASISHPELDMPVARTGRVLHPSGQAPMKVLPDGKSANLRNVENGTAHS